MGDSRATLRWMAGKGVRFVPLWGNQSFADDGGRHRFWGGLTLQADRGGPGLVLALRRAACKAKIRVHPRDARRRPGRASATASRRSKWSSGANAGASARARSCSPAAASRPTPTGGPSTSARPWRFAKVRGTRHNTGDGIAMALHIGAASGRSVVGLSRRAVGPLRSRRPATSACATRSRSTPIRSASWSTPAASASSTRASTSATTPTPATVAPCSSSRALRLPGLRRAHDAAPARRGVRDAGRDRAPTPRTHRRAGPHGSTASTPSASLATVARVQRRRSTSGRRSIRRARTAGARAASPSTRPTGRTAIDRPPFYALRGDLRHHVHRTAGSRSTRRPACSTRRAADPAALFVARRAGRRTVLGQLSRWRRAHGRAPVFGRRAGVAPRPSQRSAPRPLIHCAPLTVGRFHRIE